MLFATFPSTLLDETRGLAIFFSSYLRLLGLLVLFPRLLNMYIWSSWSTKAGVFRSVYLPVSYSRRPRFVFSTFIVWATLSTAPCFHMRGRGTIKAWQRPRWASKGSPTFELQPCLLRIYLGSMPALFMSTTPYLISIQQQEDLADGLISSRAPSQRVLFSSQFSVLGEKVRHPVPLRPLDLHLLRYHWPLTCVSSRIKTDLSVLTPSDYFSQVLQRPRNP